MDSFIIYLIVINIVTFILFGIDKRKAVKEKWRIKEATLLFFAALGGALGALFGMKVFHHKTKHKKFKYGVPALLVIQISLLCYYFIK